jgi:hypothetical protein
MKIAQALLLRKQLEAKVKQLEPIKQAGEQGIFETKVRRVNVTEQMDEVTIQAPRITLSDVTSEFDKYSSALRKLDASVQKANWEFDVDFTDKENPFEK